jgi:hypothetical protein
MKIVINTCYGGFTLSHKAMKRYAELSGFDIFAFRSEYDSSDKDFEELTYLTDKEVEDQGDEGLIFYYKDKNHTEGNDFCQYAFKRNDPILVQVVEELSDESSGYCSDLKVVEIPDDVDWEIEEYDGSEWISEKHRTWN